MQKTRLAIFASGAGSNAVNLITYFKDHPFVEVKLIVCNRPNAPVVQRVKEYNAPCVLITNDEATDGHSLIDLMEKHHINGIVLAGYLRQIPKELIAHFADRIINLHPSLLPKYGGPGMYGDRVHEAVLANHEQLTGITIHLVNEEYDKGAILEQVEFPIPKNMTLAELKSAIHCIEQEHFPLIVERTFNQIT
jgi:phosphoribosylglycinamide formyltransferase-1